ncbi:outer membrane protein assembly factor BamB [Massilia arenosa]|uniref:Outer membrane protein assembly factor BamB n=1 Tax=Zemynaea arenosa TaxID=2561931 RepID=A0A4Y9SC38_9BURK|nr:outer membrane protein assembly factor BamB [Massilia arenosa]TFW20048.1 outer membrane protein assembly factor BamB [Massilia arenosa]
MRITKNLVSASLLAVLAGCSTLSNLNPFSHKDKSSEPAKLVELKASMAVRTAWKYDIGKADGNTLTPAIVGNSVVVASSDAVARVDTATGSAMWRVKSETPITAGVGTDGEVVVAGGAKGKVMAWDISGKPLWTAQATSEVLSAPAVGQGVVVVRSIDNKILGLDAKTGQQKWFVERTLPPLTLRLAPGMVVRDKDVIIAQPGGKLLSLILATGAPRWEITVGEPRGATELERVTDLGGYPALFENDVCAASYQGRVGCWDVPSGTTRWTKELSSQVGVAVDQRFVFAVDDKSAVTAFARDTGASAWKNDKLAFRSLSTPASIGRAVAVGDYEGIVHFLSREDGAFLARASTDGSAIKAMPVVANDKLIIQTQNGTVSAIAVE